jgi:hypothetical protein
MVAPYGKTNSVLQDQLNHALPIFHDIGFGDLIVALIAAVNAPTNLTNAGLAVSTTAVNAANNILASFNGVLVGHASGAMPALAGNITNGNRGAWSFYLNSSGKLSVSAVAVGANNAAALAALPPVPAGEALIGVVVAANATGANFVGGTTSLAAANVTTAVYSTQGDAPAVVPDLADQT